MDMKSMKPEELMMAILFPELYRAKKLAEAAAASGSPADGDAVPGAMSSGIGVYLDYERRKVVIDHATARHFLSPDNADKLADALRACAADTRKLKQ